MVALCKTAEAHVAPVKVMPINWAEMPTRASVPTTANSGNNARASTLAATPHDVASCWGRSGFDFSCGDDTCEYLVWVLHDEDYAWVSVSDVAVFNASGFAALSNESMQQERLGNVFSPSPVSLSFCRWHLFLSLLP